MNVARTIFFGFAICIALVMLVYVGKQTISTHAVPSLTEYVASSTRARIASTTDSASIWMASTTIVRSLLSSGSMASTTTDPGHTSIHQLPVVASPNPISITKAVVKTPATSTLSSGYIQTPGGNIRVHVAKTPSARARGLGGYESLDTNEGMLFIFPQSLIANFWMENMKFPLDFVWIRSDRKIVGITRNIYPDTFPKTFASPGKIQFVLELNAGGADAFGLKTGAYLQF